MKEEDVTGPDLHTDVHLNGDLHNSNIRLIMKLSFKPFCLLNDRLSDDAFTAEEL